VHTSRQVPVARAAGLEYGMPFVTADLDAARRRVQDYYGRFGFNSVQVDVEPVPQEDAPLVDVTFTVTEGPQQILRDVQTEGATRTKEGVVSQTLRLHPGEPVNLAAWSQARKRLYDTNVFRQVDIEPVPMDATAEEKAANVQPVRAVVRLIEYPVWRLRYGLQVNDEKTSTPGDEFETRNQSLGVLADIRNQNLFGRALTAGVAARVERDRRSESLFVSNASFFGLPIRSYGFVFDSRQRFRFNDEVQSITDRRGASFEQRWRPTRTTEMTYGYRYERVHNFVPDEPDLFFIVNISKITAAGIVDRRDEPFEPTRGWFSAVNWDQAVTALGSDAPSAKVLFQQFYFRSVGKLVLASRAQVGTEFSSGSLVPSERFYLGGATTVRGYAENSLGPLDPAGFGGGDAMLLLNQEARFPVRGWVQGVVFVDAGNVYRAGDNISFGNVKVGYGIGLRLATPFAMLRADFGFPTSAVRPGEPKPNGRWYVGIGHIF
jgi:outer membrane protein assembly factor BamA